MKILKQLLSSNGCNRAPCSFVRFTVPTAFLLGLLFLIPGFAEAQQNPISKVDASLAPWIGVWTITDDRSTDRSSESFQNAAVEIRLTPDGKGLEISRKVPQQPDVKEVVIPDGTRRPVEAKDCAGWQSTRWVAEAGMLIGSSEMSCRESGSFATSTLRMILAEDLMVDILEIKAKGDTRLAIRHLVLKDEGAPGMGIRSSLAITAARTALSHPWNLNTIIQLSKAVDTTVLEAALLEKKTQLQITSGSLKKMQAAKVPQEIVDLLVALAFPDKFDIIRNGQVVLRTWSNPPPSGGSAALSYAPGISYSPGIFYNCYDPYGLFYGPYSAFSHGYCYNYYSPLWWDVPIYMPYSITGIGTGSGIGSSAGNNARVTPTGGYTQIQPHNTGHHAQPRQGYASTGRSGAYAQSAPGYGSGASAGAAGYGGSSGGGAGGTGSGSGSAGPSASPGGYSSGGNGSGGTAGPR